MTTITVQGQPLTTLPEDLYIPPDALEVFLETFSGPLDLLLYLIKRHNLDILDIPIAEITAQYLQYIELMKELRLELAAEYLVMAALLAEIKSRMLLPKDPYTESEEEDPRAELVRRLQEYESIKQATTELDNLPRLERDIFLTQPSIDALTLAEKPLPQVSLPELLMALKDILTRAELNAHHQIRQEALSIRERMSQILNTVQARATVDFRELFDVGEGRIGIVVSFIALLELVKQALLEITQLQPFSPIHVRMKHVSAS